MDISITDLLSTDGYIQVNKAMIKKFGLHEAILFGELCAEYNYWKRNNKLVENEMFYSTRDNIEENTGLNDYAQRKALETLIANNLIEVVKIGMPAKNYYKLHIDILMQFFTGCTTSSSPVAQQVVKPVEINNNKITNNKQQKELFNNKLLNNYEKPKKLNLWDKCVNEINDFTDDVILREYLTEFLKILLENSKESGRQLYTNTFKGKLNNLKKLTDDNYEQRKIVLRTLNNRWCGFYAIEDRGVHERLNESGITNVPKIDKTIRRGNNGTKF